MEKRIKQQKIRESFENQNENCHANRNKIRNKNWKSQCKSERKWSIEMADEFQ